MMVINEGACTCLHDIFRDSQIKIPNFYEKIMKKNIFVPLFVSAESAGPTTRVCKSTSTNLANVGSKHLKWVVKGEWKGMILLNNSTLVLFVY